MTVEVKSFSTSARIEIDISDCRGVDFNQKTCRFSCECGKQLQLDRVLIDKLSNEKAVSVLQHIIATKIQPWLDQHKECGSPTISMPV